MVYVKAASQNSNGCLADECRCKPEPSVQDEPQTGGSAWIVLQVSGYGKKPEVFRGGRGWICGHS
jgi:hypothetical protein